MLKNNGALYPGFRILIGTIHYMRMRIRNQPFWRMLIWIGIQFRIQIQAKSEQIIFRENFFMFSSKKVTFYKRCCLKYYTLDYRYLFRMNYLSFGFVFSPSISTDFTPPGSRSAFQMRIRNRKQNYFSVVCAIFRIVPASLNMRMVTAFPELFIFLFI
jgi:hypothetical protein